jgi:hypothetical protein
VVSSVESFKVASAKISSISHHEVFHCRLCRSDLAWDQIRFCGSNGLAVCRVHGRQVKVGCRVKRLYKSVKSSGKFKVCLKPYPVCGSQLLSKRGAVPVVFCMSDVRCLKAVLLDSPKKHNAAIASEQLRENKGAS